MGPVGLVGASGLGVTLDGVGVFVPVGVVTSRPGSSGASDTGAVGLWLGLPEQGEAEPVVMSGAFGAETGLVCERLAAPSGVGGPVRRSVERKPSRNVEKISSS